ncbi:MAG TPA: ABC transporter ATP-binding protein [Caulobacteraceae bacterium]|jgi:ABC-2 type transport system ATP-binding protein|nr:ABC transporter ATP-binding protein [Caulobacteraceae bacterium]
MAQVVVEDLRKTYRVAAREPGAWGAIRGLARRRWREIEALAGASFAIGSGELVGFIGPNGAGKSTTIKILSGILRPSAGACEVDGLVPWRDRIRHVARIGVVFGQRTQLWWDLPVIDGFDLLRDIYRVDPARYRRTRDELVGLMRLEPLLDQPVRQLSLGQRMRCEIAAAMLHEPRLLFLDEPTIGLDAPAKLAVRELVGTLNRERGVTVVLTTHDMQDIEALARRVIVIGKGVILADQPLDVFRAGVLAERRVVADFAGEAPRIAISGVEERARDGRSLELAFDPARIAAPALIAAIAANHPLEDIRVVHPQIEEVIARFYDLHGAGEA